MRFEVQWHARLWHRADSSMIMLMTSFIWNMSHCLPLCRSHIETHVHLDYNNNNSNSQLLRKCHNFSFFLLLFLFVFGNIYFYMIEIFRVIKSLCIMQQSGIFFFSLFYSLFALDISSTTVQFTPNRRMALFFMYYKMTIIRDRKRNEIIWVRFGWWCCSLMAE